MEHNHRSSFSAYPIPGVAAIAILLALLTIIAVLWVHIKKQEATILELHARIVTFECREETNETTRKTELHRMSLEELFKRIDDNKVNLTP